MRILLLGAALAAGFLVPAVLAGPAQADIVVLRDGRALPKEINLEPGQVPNDDQVEASRSKRLEPLGYDLVKLGGVEVPAGMIVTVYTNDSWTNPDFASGDRSAAGGLFENAAGEFERAAESLRGTSKQLALWKRAAALAELENPVAMIAAIDQLLAEFPKTFFLGDVQRRRARALASKGDKTGALAALEKVTSAPGINKHDLHETELLKLRIEKVMEAGRNAAAWAAVEAAYRDRLKAIEGDVAARAELEDLRLRALVGIGRALVGQDKAADAKKPLEEVVASPVALGDKGTLAAAYSALGDVVFVEARTTQSQAVGNEELKKKAAEQLDNALLHYLRVTEFYYADAERGDLYNARANAARVFVAMFTLSNDKDCEAGAKGLNYFNGASKLIPRGLEYSALSKEANALKARMDKVPCK
jgi:hypothetical protein